MLNIIENETGLKTRNDEIKAALQVIANSKAGLNPTSLLSHAKNPKHSLHSFFTWDDGDAAIKWREAQAYALIRIVRVTVQLADKRTVSVRAFWPVKEIEKDGTIDYGKRANYLPLGEVLKDENALAQVLANAKNELAAFRTKYQTLKDTLEMGELFDAIEKVI